MAISYHLGDITTSKAEVIVNAANERLARGAGVCGAIFAAADRVGKGSQLANDCRAVAPCPVGHAKSTSAYGVHASHIIHAVGPQWIGARSVGTTLNPNEIVQLGQLGKTYLSIFGELTTIDRRSVAIPAISTGIFGLPKEFGAHVAREICQRFANDVDVELWAYGEDDLHILQSAPTPEVKLLWDTNDLW